MRLKSELIFKDRVGIVADISALLAGFEMSIHSMEVVQTGEHAMVYVAFETARSKDTATPILERLSQIDGLEQIHFVETLPYEERENRLKVLFDNMSDGVFSIDSDGRLKTINRIALKALDLDATRDIGRHIRELDLPDLDIIGCLNGQKYTDVKKSLITRGRRFRYLATGRPIRDAAGGIIGAMEISKGLSDIDLPEEGAEDTRLRVRMSAHERRILAHTLKRTTSVREAARRLGISHPTLLTKMKKYDTQMVRNITNGIKYRKEKINN